jgi:hypothetical protein
VLLTRNEHIINFYEKNECKIKSKTLTYNKIEVQQITYLCCSNRIKMLKKLTKFLIAFCFLLAFSPFFLSCKTKEGCGYEQKMAPKTDKYGKLSDKKGKSKLFKNG